MCSTGKLFREFINPKETLLVADSATGQQAVSIAKHFDEAVGISGIVLTSLGMLAIYDYVKVLVS